jgi:amidase
VLAAGFVPLELGSDIGGSLRAPAHFCGVFSHKPTLDLVPQRGAGPPQAPAVPVRGDLAVCGPMAPGAADLALELAVLAGPDELAEGIGYKLSLPPPRHEKLPDFRVLLIDTHPLCPTAASIKNALDRLANQLAKLGCRVLRESPKLPDLARTTRTYVELLAAVYSLDLSPDDRARIDAAAKALSPEDQSLAAYTGCVASPPITRNGSARAVCAQHYVANGSTCSRRSISCCVRRCRARPSSTITLRSGAGSLKSMAAKSPIMTRWRGPASPR